MWRRLFSLFPPQARKGYPFGNMRYPKYAVQPDPSAVQPEPNAVQPEPMSFITCG